MAFRFVFVLSCAFVWAGFTGCEKKSEIAAPGTKPASGAAAPAPGDAGKAAAPDATGAVLDPAKVANPATISGTIKVTGPVPPPPPVDMVSKPECAKAHEGKPVPSDHLLAGPGGEFKDAFVYVKKGLEGKKFAVPATPVDIDQHGCMYSPHVFGIQVNQDLRILNSDPFSHNINVKENRAFNEAMTAGQAPVVRPAWFKKELVPTKFACDVHAWMSAFACVVPHPYFAVTGADGKFAIKGLPAGKYTLAVWHEAYPGLTAPAQKEIDVEVKDGETKTVDFSYTFAQ